MATRIDQSVYAEFRALAKRQERTVSQQLRLLVAEFIAEHRSEDVVA